MKRIARIHRYLSCLVAPAMLFFAVSGAWQAFRLQETKKDGSYQAPPALELLSKVHKAERLKGEAATWFRAGQLALALGFATTAILGILMALRVTRPVWRVWACLLVGILIPTLLAIAAMR